MPAFSARSAHAGRGRVESGCSRDFPMATPIPSLTAITQAKTVADQARGIARALLDGFDKHYARVPRMLRGRRAGTTRPATGSPSSTWRATGSTSTTAASTETAEHIAREYRFVGLDGAGGDALWEQVKLHFIGLLIDHKQPECAETFFNSVSVKTLRRGYFHNRFIFVRPVMSTEHIDADPPSYRSYYPLQQGLRHALIDIVLDCRFERRFADFGRDLRNVLAAFRRRCPRPFGLEANHQIQVLSSPFFRNQTAYIVGRVVNGVHTLSLRGADQARRRRQALRRRAPDGRGRSRDPVLREPRLLPGRHGSAVGVRRVPARDAPGQDRGRALHDGRAAEGAARTSSSATFSTISGTRATSSSSRPASRAS